MIEQNISIGGGLVHWRAAKATSLATVQQGLENRGLERYAPTPKTPLSCLRGVLETAYPAPLDGNGKAKYKHVVRPLKGDDKGFAVVQEEPGERHYSGDRWGTVVATAVLEESEVEGSPPKLALDPYDPQKGMSVLQQMKDAAGWLSATAVGNALVKLVGHCDGVCLRQGGGLYWIRSDRMDDWAEIAKVFEGTSPRIPSADKNDVYMLSVKADDEMIRDVGDGLESEVLAGIDAIEDGIAGAADRNELTERICTSRLREAGEMNAKVKRYEAAFSKPLAGLRDAVKRCGQAVAQATLQSSAATLGARQKAAAEV